MFKIIDVGDIPTSAKRTGQNARVKDIEKFLATGADACEIMLWENESPSSVTASLKNAISKRKHYEDFLYVVMRAGRVFLVRWPDKRSNNAK